MNKFKYYYVKLKKYLRPSDYYKIIDNRENKARAVALNLIEHKDSILKYCTITGKRYIINNTNIIIIKNDSIDFINGNLHTVKFSKKNYFLIINGFDNKLHNSIKLLEEQIKLKAYISFVSAFIDLREE